MSAVTAAAAGTIALGGELTVHRLGFGAMRLTGPGIWGPPADADECARVVRRAVDLGVTFIDTADSYGPHVADEIIVRALYPYPEHVVLATKAGLLRPGPDRWVPDGRPEHIRRSCEESLRRLRLERIDLFQLHRIDRKVPEADQFGVLADLRREGKIRLAGLSEVGVEEIDRARAVVPIAAIQNRYNLADRQWEAVVDYCTHAGIVFIPWYPLQAGAMSGLPALGRAAAMLDASPIQVAIAWLLGRSPVMLPIPGTSKVTHLEENVAAAGLVLAPDVRATLQPG